MNFSFKLLEKVKNQAGVTAVIVAIVLPMLIGFGALAVDVGYMHVTKNELQNVADAAALAGARYLGWTYEGLSRDEQQAYVFSRSDIVDVVQQIAGKNQAAKMNISINDADVTIGTWDGSTLTAMTDPIKLPVAVRVIARRDNSANGPILTFFARIFNIATVNVVADATAALTGPATVDEGELKTPFGISERMFPSDCTDIIEFSPTRDSCAGWHNFFDPINAANMKKKLLAFITGDGQGVDEDNDGISDDCLLPPCGEKWLFYNFGHLLLPPVLDEVVEEVVENPPEDFPDYFPDGTTTPEAGIGDYFEFQGGAIASLFDGWYLTKEDDVNNDADIHVGTVDADPEADADNFDAPATILALFDYFRHRDDDGNDAVWTATIPVYKEEGDSCTNPNTDLEIVGFAEIEVLHIGPPDDDPLFDKLVNVSINCKMYFSPGRGGGGNFGFLRGTIPNLVE